MITAGDMADFLSVVEVVSATWITTGDGMADFQFVVEVVSAN